MILFKIYKPTSVLNKDHSRSEGAYRKLMGRRYACLDEFEIEVLKVTKEASDWKQTGLGWFLKLPFSQMIKCESRQEAEQCALRFVLDEKNEWTGDKDLAFFKAKKMLFEENRLKNYLKKQYENNRRQCAQQRQNLN